MVLICTAFVFRYIEYFSPVPVDHFYVFGKTSLQIFCPFIMWPIYFWLLSCLSYLCILDINSFLDVWFSDFFPSFHRLPFHFVHDFFWCEEAFEFDVVPLTFYCVVSTFCVKLKKKNHCQDQSRWLTPLFLLGVSHFQVLHKMFNPF